MEEILTGGAIVWNRAVNCCLNNKAVIARPVRRLVVAIPRLEGKCTEKHPEGWGAPRFLVVIVT